MEINYKKSFLKELSKIPVETRYRIEKIVFETPIKDLLSEMLSRLKGYNNFYKIRVGDYRIGVYLDNEKIEFIRVMHRKDIYRYFP
jgi:mRNA interferase RelE/StbE